MGWSRFSPSPSFFFFLRSSCYVSPLPHVVFLRQWLLHTEFFMALGRYRGPEYRLYALTVDAIVPYGDNIPQFSISEFPTYPLA